MAELPPNPTVLGGPYDFALQTTGGTVAGDVTVTGSLDVGSMTVGALTATNLTLSGNLTVAGTVSGAGFTALLAPYALLAGPTFTGDPKAPTPATGDNDTSIATTAFVKAQNYLTANQTITLSGDVTGSGATAITATVGAISGQSVAPGSWTPVDSSGAGLVFASVSAMYTRIGNIVHAYGTVTFPVTVDATNTLIGGLPFTAANQPYSQVSFIIRNNTGTFGTYGQVITNTATFNINDIVTGAQITNAALSGKLIRWMAIYPVA